jgi:hypothetical protein
MKEWQRGLSMQRAMTNDEFPNDEGILGFYACEELVSFKPTIPATMRTMHTRRAAVRGSPKTKMPIKAVPTAPMPVQMA